MKIFTPIIALIFFIIFQCKKDEPQADADYYVVDFDDSKKTNVSLSQISDSLDFVFFQYDPENPVGRIMNYKVSDKFYFLVDQQQKLFVFKKDGQMVSLISNKGRGPAEYNNIEDFFISRDEDKIYILDPKNEKILLFDINGKHLQNQSLPFNHAAHIAGLNDDNYAIYQSARFSPKNHINIFLLNEEFQIKDSIVDPKGSLVGELPYVMNAIWYKYDEKVFFKEALVDTLFTITKDNSSKPHILFELREKRMPDNYYTSTENYRRNAHKYYQIADVSESENYVFMHIISDNESKYFIYQKLAGAPSLIELEKNGLSITDFGVNMKFWPEYIRNETMYKFIDPIEFQKHILSFPEKDSIEKILEFNNNPILLKGKLSNGSSI